MSFSLSNYSNKYSYSLPIYNPEGVKTSYHRITGRPLDVLLPVEINGAYDSQDISPGNHVTRIPNIRNGPLTAIIKIHVSLNNMKSVQILYLPKVNAWMCDGQTDNEEIAAMWQPAYAVNTKISVDETLFETVNYM